MPRRKTGGKELLGSTASMSAEVVAHLRGTDGSDAAVRISAGDAAINADALAGTELVRSVKAKPRHNEEGNPKVCGLLLTKLNRVGDTWKNLSFPDKRHSDVDCTAENDDGDILKMQVTRAARSESFWRGIGKGHVMCNLQSEETAIQNLKDAIDRKSRRLPESQKKKLLLVLDATETPDLAFTQAINSFRASLGKWAKSQSFRSIWIVGPVEDLVHRLDC
jgi:hypothetical protein